MVPILVVYLTNAEACICPTDERIQWLAGRTNTCVDCPDKVSLLPDVGGETREPVERHLNHVWFVVVDQPDRLPPRKGNSAWYFATTEGWRFSSVEASGSACSRCGQTTCITVCEQPFDERWFYGYRSQLSNCVSLRDDDFEAALSDLFDQLFRAGWSPPGRDRLHSQIQDRDGRTAQIMRNCQSEPGLAFGLLADALGFALANDVAGDETWAVLPDLSPGPWLDELLERVRLRMYAYLCLYSDTGLLPMDSDEDGRLALEGGSAVSCLANWMDRIEEGLRTQAIPPESASSDRDYEPVSQYDDLDAAMGLNAGSRPPSDTVSFAARERRIKEPEKLKQHLDAGSKRYKRFRKEIDEEHTGRT